MIGSWVNHATVVMLVTTCVPDWFMAQSCRVAISDYSAAQDARAGVRSAHCIRAHERAVSDNSGKSPQYNANDSLQTVVS
jgi:uncharacterized protein YgiB involved in biofilm formation